MSKLDVIAQNNRIIAENIPKVFEAGQKSVVDESKLLPTTVKGDGFIHLEDVSEIPHEVEVKVWSNNLLDIDSMLNDVLTKNGDEYVFERTNNTDGWYSRASKPLRVFIPANTPITLSAEIVTYNGVKNMPIGVQLRYEDNSPSATMNLNTVNHTITKTFTKNIIEVTFYISHEESAGVITVFKKPMLEIGTEATPYVPYGETTAPVTVCGRNLFDVSKLKATSGTYCFYPIPIEKWRLTLIDRDTSVDMTGINYGIAKTVNGNLIAYRWFHVDKEFSDINCANSGIDGALCDRLMLYPNNAEVIEKFTKRFDIMVTEEHDVPVIYEPFSTFEVTAPTTIKSVSPYMNFMSDNPLEVGYNKSWGMQKAYDDSWDNVQNCGKRTGLYMGFAGNSWNDSTFRPKYPFANISEGNYMCHNSRITYCPTLDWSDLSSVIQVFNGCKWLRTVEKVIVSNKLVDIQASVFNCERLKDIRFEGELVSNLRFVSGALTKESIKSVFNVMSTTTSGLTFSLFKSAVNREFETSEGARDGITSSEWLNLIATRNNWTISLV